MPPVRDARGRFTSAPAGPLPNNGLQKWESPVLREFDDGSKILRLVTIKDHKTLGLLQGHCAGGSHHLVPCLKFKCNMFLVLIDKDETPKVALHCKAVRYAGTAPKEASHERTCNEYHRDDMYGYYSEVQACQAYDYGGYGRNNLVGRAEQQLAGAKRDYERIKADAIRRYGPLGRDHPMKQDVDYYNKRVTDYKGYLDEAKAGTRLDTGRKFQYPGLEQPFYILSVSSRGLDYSGKDNRYTPNILEFIGKEL